MTYSNEVTINPAAFSAGLIVRHKDVPPPAEGRREPVKRQQIRNLRQRFAGDDEIDQDDLFRRWVNQFLGTARSWPE